MVSLTGGAELKSQAINRLRADAIHFWLLEKPQGQSQQAKLQPDRMLALGHVKARLAAVFRDRGPIGGVVPAGAAAGGESGGTSAAATQRGTARRSRAPDAARPEHRRPAGCRRSARRRRAQKGHMVISGRLLRAEVLLSADQKAGELSDLTVVDNVRFVETQTALPDQRPLLMTGNWLKVIHANRPDAATARILGQPAHVEGRGLSLTGSNVNLDSGANRLWIDGPGRMDLPIGHDMEGHPLQNPVNVQVNWQRKMTFDGSKAIFEHSVVATGPTQKMRTEVMEVQLQQPIRFADAKANKMDQSQIEEIRPRRRLPGELFLRSAAEIALARSHGDTGPGGQHALTGALWAGGPGWLVSVRRAPPTCCRAAARPPRAARPTGLPPRGPRAPPPRPAATSFPAMHVRYQGYITGYVAGELHHHEVTFHDQVRGAYAPVDSWTATIDTNSPETLGPDGAVLHCDQLSAVNMTPPHSKDAAQRDMEFVATGNAVAEGAGDLFTARAARITYDQKKQLAILEGDGRTDADSIGSRRPAAPSRRRRPRKSGIGRRPIALT